MRRRGSSTTEAPDLRSLDVEDWTTSAERRVLRLAAEAGAPFGGGQVVVDRLVVLSLDAPDRAMQFWRRGRELHPGDDGAARLHCLERLLVQQRRRAAAQALAAATGRRREHVAQEAGLGWC